MSQKVHCFESPSKTTIHILCNNKLHIHVSVKTDHHDKKHIVVNEGDTPITQSTKVVLAATKTRIIYCGFFSKTSNQHGAQWRGLGDTQRQAWEFILGSSLGTRAKFMTFNRIQSRVVTGLLMGHNTLRRHLYLLGLLDSPLCRKCGVGEETSAHILFECDALASLRHVYLGSFFLEPEDIKSLGLGAIWNYSKVVGLPWFDMGHKGPILIKA